MKPVDMLVMHDPENGQYGDCFRACIASIMGGPAEEVPHFADYNDELETDKYRWYREVNRWLSHFGLAYIMLEISSEHFGPSWFREIGNAGFSGCYHVMTGMSPRFPHAVVGLNGMVVHDPHPSRAGLIAPCEDGYSFGFIIYRGGIV